MEEAKTTMSEETKLKGEQSIKILCVAILQKYKGIDGWQMIFEKTPEEMVDNFTKMLWRKGYLYGFGKENIKVSSLGEQVLKRAIVELKEEVK